MIVLGLVTAAFAQDYAFPTSLDDYAEFYPTAYKDQGGNTDWNCDSVTYSGHDGSDFGMGGFAGMDDGRDVTAAADGEVVLTHDGEFDRCTSAACGTANYIVIRHADGKDTWYWHLKEFSLLVGVGDQVVCGQKIGEAGSSGNSTGPHLHFQVQNASGNAEDPFDGPCSAPPTYWLDQGVHGGVPGNTCGPAEPCTPTAALACGQVVSTTNDGPGSTSATYDYGCSDFVYSGPELSWTFTSPVETPVTLSMTGLAEDLDLYVVGSTTCAGDDCIASSTNPSGDETVEFVAEAGVAYVVVVDGWDGGVSAFDLDVACDVVPDEPTVPGTTDTSPPGSDTSEPGSDDTAIDPDDTDAPGLPGDTDLPGDDEVPVSTPRVVSGQPGGCGCASTGAGAGPLAGAMLALGLWGARRRRS